jgi:hypothetical protein
MVKKNKHSSSGDARNSAVERLNDHGQPAILLARLQIASRFFPDWIKAVFSLPLPWPRLPAFFIMLPARRFTERMISLPRCGEPIKPMVYHAFLRTKSSPRRTFVPSLSACPVNFAEQQ